MWLQLVLTLLIALTINANYVGANCKRFDNWRLYETTPNQTDQLGKLKFLDDASNGLIFLKPVYAVGTKIQAIVSPNRDNDWLANLDWAKLPYVLVNENVQSIVDSGQLVVDCIAVLKDYTWKEYHELDVTYDWMHQLTKKYPKQVSTFVAGKSYEGRELLGVKISHGNKTPKSANKRRSIFIESGIHAREWIAPAAATYIINQLLTSKDKNVRRLAKKYVWYIVPHFNPDGYVYTHTTDRLWRKTLNSYGECFGADLNRNWGYHWFEGGASNDTYSETYAGPRAFSEIELRSAVDYMRTLKDELLLYLSFHSYSQMLLYPYAYTDKLPANNKDLRRVSDAAVAAIGKRYGTKYIGGNLYTTIYPASGNSLDFVYDVLKVPYVYCYEMRPLDNITWDGNILPAKGIIRTSEELLDSIVAMLQEIEKIGGN